MRDYVRQHGDTNILVTYRTPIPGLKEIVASTQLTSQHVIISAYFDETRGWWVPHGAFEIRGGRVLRLDKRRQTQGYNSVDDFAAALADPPPTEFPE